MAKTIKIAPEEQAIAWAKKLEKLLLNYPKGHWLFSASGSLSLLKTDVEGNRVIAKHGGVDQDYKIYKFSNNIIENDGGDW